MTVRGRLLCLLSVLAAFFLFGAFGMQVSENHQARLIAENDQREQTLFFTKILDLKGASLESLTYDYTYWDEMVRFVADRDPQWASENLASALSTYQADGIWVFDARQRLLYSVSTPGHAPLKTLPITPACLAQAFGGRHFCHFYLATAQGVVEIRGGEIHATKDRSRTGKSYGVFLTGRLWDNLYLKSLAGLTTARVSLQTLSTGATPDVRSDPNDDLVDFYQRLSEPGGRPICLLHLQSESRGVRLVREGSAHMLMLQLMSTVALLALLSGCLLHWVSRPLWAISESLKTRDISNIRGLTAQTTEFGSLARMIERFFAQQAELQAAHEQLETRVAERTADLANANRLLGNAYTATIMGWSRAMDLRDHETEGHCQRVTAMTLRLARGFGLAESDLVEIQWGALLHDIGKMGVPDHILRKAGPLTAEEWDEMRMHPTYAYEMLQPISFLHSALDIPWCHHERWDGTGYPRGLKGDEIPLAARLFAIVDVWDALRSDRPYREGWSPDQVARHIQSLAGSHFDPELVPPFLALAQSHDADADFDLDVPLLRLAA